MDKDIKITLSLLENSELNHSIGRILGAAEMLTNFESVDRKLAGKAIAEHINKIHSLLKDNMNIILEDK